MKRLLLAGVLAMMLHGLFLAVFPKWAPSRPAPLLRPRPVTVALSYRSPQRPAAPPAKKPLRPVRPPAPIPKKPPEKKEKAPTPKPPKPQRKPPKKVKAMKPPLPAPKKPLKPLPKPRPLKYSPPLEQAFQKESRISANEILAKDVRPLPGVTAPQEQKGEGKSRKVLETPALPLVEASPLYRENPAPRYPSIARRRGYQGTVLLKVLVNREGKVKDLSLFQSSGYPVLDRAAISSVKRWLFEPGKRGDESIEMWVKIPVRFRLK